MANTGKKTQEPATDILFSLNCNHVALLKSCAKRKDLLAGSRIHAVLHQRGLIKKDKIIASTLLTMYGKCGCLAKAQEVFEELPARDVISWTSLIDAYAHLNHGKEALHCFEQMQAEGFLPNAITYLCTTKACSSIGAIKMADKICALVVSQSLLGEKQELGNALVDMYAKCGILPKAQAIFDGLPIRNVVSFNVLIAGYAQHGHNREAVASFERMESEGLSPNTMTFFPTLKACCSLQTAEKGREMHAELARQGMLRTDIDIGNTLVDMYMKCGALAIAQEVFDEIPGRTVVSWNVLISGYVQHGYGKQALWWFKQMEGKGISPDHVTFLCVLKACSSLGVAEEGKAIHAEITRRRMVKHNCVLGNALIDMYAKCGSLRNARQVLSELHVRDVVSWTALMVGFAEVGEHKAVFHLFHEMIRDGIRPNLVTFVVVLNACGHAGVVGEGQLYFETMSATYGIIPTVDHHTCMVDLFSRAGHFDKAMAVVKKMRCHDYPPTWCALLGACKKWGNMDLGRSAFEHTNRMDQAQAQACMYVMCD